MKKIFTYIALLFATAATAQTTATNFTATDCATPSTSHTLFTELDNGKVVVLVWVMPCPACVSDAKAAYDAAQSFGSSNPGKVLYYLADDGSGGTCSGLSSWATTNGIGANAILFDNAGGISGTPIDEANYGGAGMPHVTVMGGSNHKIYFNKLSGSGDGTAIQSAISNALSPTGVSHVENENISLNVYPNPARNKLFVNYTLASTSDINIEVINVIGGKVKVVHLDNQPAGPHEINLINDASLSNGVYFLKISTESSSQMVKFTVAN